MSPMLPLMSVLVMGLIVEMVFFGPLGLNLFNVPVRRVLIGACILASLVPMLTRKTTDVWQLWLMIAMIMFLLLWGLVIPMLNGVELRMAFAEIQPAVAVILILPFYYLFLQYGPYRYLRVAELSLIGMAIIVIAIWFMTNILGLTSIGYALREAYRSLNDNDFGVYIGLMPDGSFRIMIINFILFPIMVSYYTWRKVNYAGALLFLAATFATGTRAFLAIAVLTMAVALVRTRPKLALPLGAVAVYVLFFYFLRSSELRIFDFMSDLTSSSARYVQFFTLMELFDQYPIFGAGLGASGSVVRSVDAPYSYELTYIALLAKLGLVGSATVVLALALWIGKLVRRSPDKLSIVMLVTGFVLMTASNPYLINLVGMSIVAFLVALGLWFSHGARPVPVTRVPLRMAHA